MAVPTLPSARAALAPPETYPLLGYHFEVRVDTAAQAYAAFAEVSGLDAEREIEEIREGGENAFVHQVPGRMKPGRLVLRRGMVARTNALFTWCQAALESDLGQPLTPRDISVSLLDPDEHPVLTWQCTSAWPVRWSIAGLDAMQGQVAMETLEFAYARLTRAYNG